MEEIQQQTQQEITQESPKESKLPKSFTTVTTASKLLALFLFILLPFAGFYMGMRYQKAITQTDTVQDSQQNTQTPTQKPRATLLPKPTSKPAQKPSGKTTYQISITSKEKPIDQIQTSLEIVDVLKINNSKIPLYFKRSERDYKDSENIILYFSGDVDGSFVGKTHSTDSYVFDVTHQEGLSPNYLSDSKYCELDSDCSYTFNFCNTGSYNEYHQWAVYGCGESSGYEGLTEDEWKARTDCDKYEHQSKPQLSPTNAVVTCEENQCVTKSVDFQCYDIQ